MARKTTSVQPTKTPAKTLGKTTSTPVRNSAVPKKTIAKKPIVISQEMIAERAYFISLSGTGASELDNWYQAQRELTGAI